MNFTIYNKSLAPVVDDVRPYNDGSQAVFTWGTNTFGNSMDINFTENRTVTFDVNVSDGNGDEDMAVHDDSRVRGDAQPAPENGKQRESIAGHDRRKILHGC